MIRVLIYEDNTQLREGLAILIGGTDGFELVGTFPNCSNIVEECSALQPDVILMDINMPVVDGLTGLRELRKHNKEVKVLMLTVFNNNQNVFEAIKNGANGYLLKKTPPAKLIEYIQDAQLGGAPMTSSIAAQVLKMFAQNRIEENEYPLSGREKEVLDLLVKGHSYKMVAYDLDISLDTVRTHVKRIYDKLQVNSKSEAISKVLKNDYL